MPPGYVVLHLSLTVLAVAVALRLPGRSAAGRLLGWGLLLLVVGGMLVERVSDFAWAAMRPGWPDLVYFTNFTLPGVAVLLVVMWRRAPDAGARGRALLLTPAALGAALWSYAWYFLPVPAGLAGRADATGYCAQTSDDSCSAAAAVMLLHAHGIPASEAEMARLCLTRAGQGTTPLGLYRGLALKARKRGMVAALITARTASGRPALTTPAIVSIGLSRLAPQPVVARLAEFGWQPGPRHAVLFQQVKPTDDAIPVADPSYGRERWPVRDPEDLRWLWDGMALILLRSDGPDEQFRGSRFPRAPVNETTLTERSGELRDLRDVKTGITKR